MRRPPCPINDDELQALCDRFGDDLEVLRLLGEFVYQRRIIEVNRDEICSLRSTLQQMKSVSEFEGPRPRFLKPVPFPRYICSRKGPLT